VTLGAFGNLWSTTSWAFSGAPGLRAVAGPRRWPRALIDTGGLTKFRDETRRIAADIQQRPNSEAERRSKGESRASYHEVR
jgi:hypothetical protein